MIYLFLSKQKIERKAPIQKLCKEKLGEVNNFNFVKIEGTSDNIGDIIFESNSMPFGSENKIVLIDSPFFLNDKNPKFNEQDDFEKLCDVLKHPCDEIDLVFSCDLDNYKKGCNEAVKLIEKGNVEIIDSNVDFKTRIIKRVQNRGGVIDSNAAEELAKRLNGNLEAMVSETNKLMLYTDHIKLIDVIKLVAKPLEENVFSLCNALVRGNNMLAFDVYRDLKVTNVEPVTIISILGNQFRLINNVKFLHKEGKSLQDIANELKINEVRAKITLQNANKISAIQLNNIIKDLAELDMKIKSGETDRFYAFELFLINFKIS